MSEELKSVRRELIKSINVDKSNFKYCGENKIINGSLLVDIERIMEDYHQHCLVESLKFPQGMPIVNREESEKQQYIDDCAMKAMIPLIKANKDFVLQFPDAKAFINKEKSAAECYEYAKAMYKVREERRDG